MAEASTESIVPLSTFEEQVRLDKSQEYVTSYNGEVCHLTNENGILKFSLRGSKCYVFFIFKNVYSARDNKAPIHPNQISIKQAYNFHILPVSFRSVNNVRCFHAGLVWKRSKPKDVLDISFDPDKAISVLKSFARTNVPAPVPVLQLPSPLPKVVKPREVKQILSGQTGIVWKALNDREGLMLIRKDKAGKIIWFNKSNLEKVQAKFVQLRQLVGVALHFDAELLHAPANPDDFLWYQGTAFWDSGQLRPSIPNGFVGVKILNYKPTHDFSVKLKQAVELKTTGQFPQDGIDKIFKELTMARMFKDVTSPSKKENKDNEVAQLWDSVKRLNEGLKSLKLETERRTSLPGSDVRDEDPRTKSCNSLPNAVRNERPPQTDPKPLWIFQPIELNNTQQNRKESPSSAYSLLNLQSIKKEDPRSTFLFPAPVNNLKPVQRDESFEEAMLKTALKNSLRDEAVMPESLMNRIVDNFSKRLTKEMFQGNKKNKTDTKEKATQTLSTGKVIYLKVHPS